jgi:tRNA(Phe) wybutosine-synthesizing methylase Tyw3
MASAASGTTTASAPEQDGFAQRRAQTLAELAADAGDFSRAGGVDERARPVVYLVNRHPSFFTTSSCAGRVSLFADPTSATRSRGMKGGEWVYVNHDPADADAVVEAVARKLGEGGGESDGAPGGKGDDGKGDGGEGDGAPGGGGGDPECTLVLRFEPFILSVEAVSIEEGSRMVAAARDAVGTLYKLKRSRPITRKRLVTTLGSHIK